MWSPDSWVMGDEDGRDFVGTHPCVRPLTWGFCTNLKCTRHGLPVRRYFPLTHINKTSPESISQDSRLITQVSRF